MRCYLRLPGFVLIVGFAAAGVGCNAADGKIQQVASANDLKTRMNEPGVLVIHTLDRENFVKGHIPGAIHIEYEKMVEAMLPPDKNKPLVFYCAGPGCPVSRMAARKAVGWGYQHVWVYEGGISDWRQAGMQVASGD